jgi:outer membrane protein assembly factor BamE (lipoprotein component of BamABCDE complex)
MNKYFALAALSALVFGCASAGNDTIRTETMDTVGTKVVRGVTTKDKIRELYGSPLNVSLTDGGSEVWNYEYTHATATAASYVPIVGLFAGGTDVSKNQVVFIFNKDGVMQNYTVHATQTQVRQGGSDVGEE